MPLATRPSHLRLLNIRAIDGDTIEAHIELPLGILARRRIRLKGFFAPEHHGATPDGAAAAQAALQAACDGKECHIATYGMREDRYGRLAATLFVAGEPALPGAILGVHQLSPEQHRSEVHRARAGREKRPPKES